MNIGEVFGYVAAGLVLATFSMRTMIPLRYLGIASNIAFISYGYVDGLYPVLVLHALLLPLNIYRLIEMRRLIREVKSAGNSAGIDVLLPFMRPVSKPAGATLFSVGEDAVDMFLLTEGRIRLQEFGVDLQPGEVIGEIGVFSPHGKRTATAVCIEDCRLQCISRERVRELVFQNPRFGFYLLGLIAGRLIENMKDLEGRVAQAERQNQPSARQPPA
jgi:CRP/FNR family transcriptional regulator, cyclic AMP receptor protein